MKQKYTQLVHKMKGLFAQTSIEKEEGPKPYRDWLIILGVCTVAMLAVSAVGMYLYFARTVATELDMSSMTIELPLDTQRLTEALETFDTRVEDFQQLRMGRTTLEIPQPGSVPPPVPETEEEADGEVEEES